MRKKVDERIRTLIENGVKTRHRSIFVIVGDKYRDQVVNLHHMLSKSVVKSRPTVLWCYKDRLDLSSHKKKRSKQIKKLMQRGLLDPEKVDPFSLFLESGGIKYCLYKDSERILGNTFGMCVLQDFEALTLNLLARTIETVEGGGLILLLLRSLTSLTSLYTMVMDVHGRFRTESHSERLRGKDADITQEATEIQDYIETLQCLPKSRMLDLFKKKYIHPLIIGVGLMVFQQFGGINGIGFYVSETFESAGSSGKTGTIAYACVQVPITMLGAILIDMSGRRPLIVVSAIGTFLGCFLTGMSFFLKSHELLLEWVPMLAVAGVLIYIGSFAVGMGPVPWVMMSEVFPINVKGAAGSFVTLVCWFGAWAVSYTFNFFMNWSSSGTFFFYAGVSAITVLFVVKFVPETKDRTLEEIQESMNL